ncbi:CheW protein [Magnetococcus marinus MC-1]|uniref:CheW protein n=1 Tax=Magnetococcus marinus (strain ATCC BAA-1437 / JCM 17883 / MC-1) TaxID=156889 RepID=A0L6J6_MAGMM|nr:chemotaxis protein CheW [Magnetococcus marinus]ABK43589.1 CheW protein [Magnetococcus marinus MC-1]
MVLCTFRLGDVSMGIDIRMVQEIKRCYGSTPVPGSPNYIRGMLNNRGRVTTLYDLRNRLGWLGGSEEESSDPRKEFAIILKTRSHVRQIDEELAHTTVFWNDSVALIVDQLGGVLEVSGQQLRPSPANMAGISAQFISAVVQQQKDLLVILDVPHILGFDPQEEIKKLAEV